jgi:four helix bundle protein
MKYDRFEDLPVWQAASDLALRMFTMGEKLPLRRHRSLRDQIERAALSVSNNIAEGFERGTTNELLAFLYIARGSAGEVRSMLCMMERMSEFSNLKSEISNFKSLAESISRQLRGWAQHLQDSPIRGQRHLTSKTRMADEAKRDRDEFLRELDAMRKKNAPEQS